MSTQPRGLPLAASVAGESAGARVRRWWRRGFRKSSFNGIYGLFLLVPAGLLTQTFFGAFSRATLEHSFWATEEFWFFGLGAILWVLWFFGSIWAMGEPRPLRAYVFGHELTHAIWVWLLGGKVDLSQFEVTREGGQVVVSKSNFFIALAPYFYPLYSLVVIVLYGLASLFYRVASTTETFLLMTPLQGLFLLLGGTWAFHLTFTCWMIPKGQSDLTAHGTFFSLVVIYLMNLVVLAIFLILLAPEVTWTGFAAELLTACEDFSAIAVRGLQRMWESR